MAKKETAQETPEVENTEAQTETSVEPVQLTIQDLQNLAQIINLASKRGAFETTEFVAVGNSFNKLTNFLSFVQAQAESAEEESKEMAEEESAATEE